MRRSIRSAYVEDRVIFIFLMLTVYRHFFRISTQTAPTACTESANRYTPGEISYLPYERASQTSQNLATQTRYDSALLYLTELEEGSAWRTVHGAQWSLTMQIPRYADKDHVERVLEDMRVALTYHTQTAQQTSSQEAHSITNFQCVQHTRTQNSDVVHKRRTQHIMCTRASTCRCCC